MQILLNHPELEALGFTNLEKIYWQLHTSQLYEQAVRRYEGMVAHLGPLVVRTGNITHHVSRDSFIVRESTTQHDIAWGEHHRYMEPETFDRLYQHVLSYLQGKTIFVQNVFVGANETYRMPFRIITETAWHNLFARNMFFLPTEQELDGFLPDFTLIHVGGFRALPEVDGTNSDVFVVVNFARKLILIGGTNYAGEIKKAVFSVLNYLLPHQNALPMRCGANQSPDGNVALFFGRSGTGKTTLATDPQRLLIGDDEHVWTEEGIFSIERGGYANIIDVSPRIEPAVYETTRRFGTILENVAIDVSDRRLDLHNAAFTDNIRASYPLSHLSNLADPALAGHPQNIIFLVKDAFGVLPPVAQLSLEQALFYFRLGYTSKFVNGKPVASFSACFDEASMPLHPGHYVRLLERFLQRYDVPVWLVNTGWIGGPTGVGEQRIKLAFTRAIISAIVDRTLATVEYRRDPIFGLNVPLHCPDVFDGILNPRANWHDERAYEKAAQQLLEKFLSESEQYALVLDE